MTQIPLFAGITTDGNADFRTAYPVNMVPVPMAQGISDGYLRPADGIATLAGRDDDFPNLITNGTFNTDIASWTDYNTADITWYSATESMRIMFAGGGSSEPASYQDVTTVADVSYQVTFDMTRIDPPVAGRPPSIGYCKVIDVFTGATLVDEQFYVEGGKTVQQAVEFTASGTQTRIVLGTIYVLGANFPLYLDNVEVREYFRATDINRGGINWEGTLYRVIGEDLYRITSIGNAVPIGTIGGTGRVRMTYSFDYLAIASSDQLWLYNGTTLAQVTDVDLGNAKDVIFIDGYFMTTDGEFLVVTELNDPFSVDPLKYGSSEINPDPILALLKVRNEAYAMNRYTIEVFANVGTSGFPFQRIPGAQIEKGVVGRDACTVFMDAVVFVGSGYNEAIGVYIAAKGGGSTKISTREIDDILAGYTEAELQNLILTTRVDRNHQHLHIRMPDGQTFVFDQAASQALQNPIWFRLCSDCNGGEYRATDIIWCYDQWNVADTLSNKLGYLTPTVSTHWDEKVRWEFTTLLLYNESRGAIVHELELVALTGRTALGEDPVITAEYTLDGLQWSQPRTIAAGVQGDRQKRLRWLSQGKMHNFRGQRFSGTSDAFISIARLEARLEPLSF